MGMLHRWFSDAVMGHGVGFARRSVYREGTDQKSQDTIFYITYFPSKRKLS